MSPPPQKKKKRKKTPASTVGTIGPYPATVELQWLEHFWNHENMFELINVDHSARSGGIIGISL